MTNKETKKNNKGFSLVELIIVIAIMAVLIAILAPAFIRYVEQSRQKADLSAVDDVIKAVKTSAASSEITIPSGTTGAKVEITTSGTNPDAALQKALENSDVDDAKLKSSEWGTVTIQFTTSGGAVDAKVTSNGTTKMENEYHK